MQWRYKIDLRDEFTPVHLANYSGKTLSKSEFLNFRDKAVKKIMDTPAKNNLQLSQIIDKLKIVATISKFDKLWKQFYDICDYYKIWVETI